MNRIDFHSIATILLSGLIAADYSQMDFIYMLFGSFANDNVDFAFDNGLVCKWIKGQSRISPKIISYYNSEKNRDKFCKDIESELLPYISDVSYTISAIRDLVLCDITTSDEKKDALLTHFDNAPAHFLCDILIYGFSRSFVKAGNKNSGSVSPRVDDIMYLPLLPKPTKYFTGRSYALIELHQLLNLHSAVIVNGIPGIGKSELVKAYVQLHLKDYTNILYFDYEKSLYNVICNVDFVDDTDSMAEKERFRKHFRFLRSLKEDSLIVIDNLDNSRDELLPQICEFKCHILITSRMNLAQYANYELTNSPDDAMEIMHSYYPGISDYYHSEIKGLIETVCNHTMSIQLIARLLSLSVYTPDMLLDRLKENVLLKTHNLFVGNSSIQTDEDLYSKQLSDLIGFHNLSEITSKLLRVLALCPEYGMPLNILYHWYGSCTHDLLSLEENGFVRLTPNHVTIQPYIRKIINAHKLVSLNDNSGFFEHIITVCQEESNLHATMAISILATANRFVQKDAPALWRRCIIAALEACNRYRQYNYYQSFLDEWEYLCYMQKDITNEHQALLAHFKAIEKSRLQQNNYKAVELEEQAIAIATGKGTTNIPILCTFYQDAGNYYHKLGNRNKAFSYCQKSMQLLDTLGLKYTLNGLSAMIQYDRLLTEAMEYSDAILIYMECLNIVTAIYGKDSLTKGYLSQNLAAIYASLKNIRLATIYLTDAIAIMCKYLDSDHPDIEYCKQQLSQLKSAGSDAIATLQTDIAEITLQEIA